MLWHALQIINYIPIITTATSVSTLLLNIITVQDFLNWSQQNTFNKKPKHLSIFFFFFLAKPQGPTYFTLFYWCVHMVVHVSAYDTICFYSYSHFIFSDPQDRRKRGRLQCLKWAVSQCPWSFPSFRNLIINNRWHIRDKRCKGVLCVLTQQSAYIACRSL